MYAIWHHQKAAMALDAATPPYGSLEEDDEWQAFLAEYPDIEAMDASYRQTYRKSNEAPSSEARSARRPTKTAFQGS